MKTTQKPVILVVDAQGGGLGKQLITSIRKECGDVRILAVGTNTAATAAMLKAGADVKAKNADGRTALDYALEMGNTGAVEALEAAMKGL